jgi:hypothetical protein
MPDITLENGIVVEGFPDNPTSEDLAKLDRIKKKYQTVSQPTPTTPSEKATRSPLESGLIGASRGATFGLAPKIIAGLESTRSQFTNKPRSYEDVLQEATGMYKQASEQNPASYLTGEIGAGVAAPIGQAATGAKLGRLAIAGAGTGALSGLGYSEGQDIGQVAKDVAIGTALGGGLPVLGRGIAIGAQKAKVLADEAIKTGLTGFTGKTRAFLDQLDKNPEQVKRIEEKFAGDIKTDVIPEIYQKIESFVEKNPFKIKAQANSAKSVSVIPEGVRIQKKPALNILDSTIKRLEKDNVTDTAIEAVNKLKSYKQRIIEGLGDTEYKEVVTKPGMPSIGIPDETIRVPIPSKDISGRDLKEFLKNIAEDVQKYGGYGNPLANSKVGDTLKNVRRSFDKQLKDEVPEYANIMKGVEADTIKSIRLTKQFMNKEGIDSSKINKFIERSSSRPDLLKTDLPTKKAINILEEGSQDLSTLGQDLSDIYMKRGIESRANQGSNLTNPVVAAMTSLGLGLGGAAGGFGGAGLGGTVGGFLGGIAARQLEQRGGKISESAMRLSKGFRTPTAIPEATQRGFQAQQGLQRGLLDQFLTENAGEVRRKREMESKFQQDNQNRVTK